MSSSDIPTQEDVDQWPYLQGVFLLRFAAEVRLLIARDAPKALHPLEMKHSQDGGLGFTNAINWAVNSPLGRSHQNSWPSSFAANVDHQLQQMIEGFTIVILLIPS